MQLMPNMGNIELRKSSILLCSNNNYIKSADQSICLLLVSVAAADSRTKSEVVYHIQSIKQGCGYTMPDLSDLVPFHSGQVENFNLLVLEQVQNLL